MSEVDLPRRIERYGGAIGVVRIALLSGFDTPALYSCWEIDAMNPVDLRARVERRIRSLVDRTAWELAQKAEAVEIAPIDDVLDRWHRAISGPDAK